MQGCNTRQFTQTNLSIYVCYPASFTLYLKSRQSPKTPNKTQMKPLSFVCFFTKPLETTEWCIMIPEIISGLCPDLLEDLFWALFLQLEMALRKQLRSQTALNCGVDQNMNLDLKLGLNLSLKGSICLAGFTIKFCQLVCPGVSYHTCLSWLRTRLCVAF